MEDDKKRGGMVCSCKGCTNKSYSSNEKFYSFPRDAERAKAWLIACNRQDLMEKVDTLYKSYRLCSSHFEPHMFSKKKRKLLRPVAIPTIFPSLSDSLTDIVPSTSALTPLPEAKTSNILDSPTTASDLPLLSNTPSAPTPPPILSTVSVQTPAILSSHTPGMERLRTINKDLRKENSKLKKENQEIITKCNDLQLRLENIPNEITLEQYKSLTYKLCPSKEIAEFINVQISQIHKSPKGRRYSIEFKYKCLRLYFSGPKLYKTLLMNLFCLPGPQTLQKLLKGIDISPGLENLNIFKTLKLKVDNLNEHNRLCVLCIDEISIKSNLFYSTCGDNITGLEDHGNGDRVLKQLESRQF